MAPALARKHAVARVLDEAPVSRRRLGVWALAASGIGLDGYDLFIMSVAGPLIVADLGLSSWQDSVAVGAAVLGAVPGALLSGRIADRIGRRAMLKIDLILFLVTAILSAFAWDVWSLAVFRFLQGAAVGAEYPLSASMVSEVMPARKRGVWMTGAFSFQAIGMVLGAGAGFVLLTLMPEETTWRWMLLSGVVPAAIVAILRLRIPESPRWEAERGNLEQAEKDTEWLTGQILTVTEEDIAFAQVYDAGPQPRMTFKDLWAPVRRRALILTTVPWFLMDIALYGIGLFTPTILAGLTGADPNTHMAKDDFIAADIAATGQAAFTDLFLIIGFVLNMILVERAGRIQLQIVGFLGMAVGLGTLAVVGSGGPLWILLASFIVFNTMVNMGPNATTYLLPAEVFPTRLRATGHGVAAAAGKVGAVVGTFLLPIATASVGLSPTIGVIAVFAVLGAVVTFLFRIETRGRELRD